MKRLQLFATMLVALSLVTPPTVPSTQPDVVPDIALVPIIKTIPPLNVVVFEPVSEIWAVRSSPHPQVSVEQINIALEEYRKLGLSKHGAAYLVGNFIGESMLVPCGLFGDGGLAEGLAQWHPPRRPDMPCDYVEQLRWAVEVEMMRDYPPLRAALNGGDVGAIISGLKNWERYGVEGARYQYGAFIHSQL